MYWPNSPDSHLTTGPEKVGFRLGKPEWDKERGEGEEKKLRPRPPSFPSSQRAGKGPEGEAEGWLRSHWDLWSLRTLHLSCPWVLFPSYSLIIYPALAAAQPYVVVQEDPISCPEDHLHREETRKRSKEESKRKRAVDLAWGRRKERNNYTDASWDQPSSQCVTLPWAFLNSESGHRGCTVASHFPNAHLSCLSCQHVQDGRGFPVLSDALTEQQGWRERHCPVSDVLGSWCVLLSPGDPWMGCPDAQGQPTTGFGAALQATLVPAPAQTLFFKCLAVLLILGLGGPFPIPS